MKNMIIYLIILTSVSKCNEIEALIHKSINKGDKVNSIINFNSDINIMKLAKAFSINSESITLEKEIVCEKEINSNEVISQTVETNLLYVDQIFSNSGVLTFEGNILINSNFKQPSNTVNSQSFSVDSVKQFSLVQLDDFESENKEKEHFNNWINGEKEKLINNEYNFYLTNKKSHNEVYKNFELPKHKYLKIQGSFHFLDFRQDETAYIKIDDKVVWKKKVNIINKNDFGV